MSDFIKEEGQYLDLIESKLNVAYVQFKDKIEEYDRKYMEAKRYLVDYKDELDSMEIFSNQRSID